MKNKYLTLLLSLLLFSCEEFLDAKPDKALVVPKSLNDFRSLLDNTSVMNEFPSLGVIAAGDYYLGLEGINGLGGIVEKNTYTWEQDLYGGTIFCPDWDVPFKQIFYANVTLEGLAKLKVEENERVLKENLEGSAYFFRAWAFFNLAQHFCKPGNINSPRESPGIPLKLEADVSVKQPRANLEDTFKQIISDLTQAVGLLPEESHYPARPDKIAAYAFLARVYHTLENYEEALKYANICLSLKNELIDYNTLNPAATRPFPQGILGNHKEVIYYSRLINYGFFFSGVLFPDSALLNLFKEGDLRKNLFFHASTGRFIGSYTGDSRLFSGLAIDEIILIRAESYARLNQAENACEDLNRLLVTRYKNGTYVPLKIADKEELVRLILAERRKQLFSRGLRWIDLRRTNSDPIYADTLHRVTGERKITIYPNDTRYVLTIPDSEILRSGIEQNER